MNPKKFTVIDSETQKTRVIESTATTVAELKNDLRANGFDLSGKTIQEGLTRIEFKSDDALLPHDVPRNGGVTNDLVFRLTKAQKNIKSGAMSRTDAYAAVKKLGLGDAIKAKYGKNFTQCSTADLVAEVEKAQKKSASAPKAEPKKEAPKAAPAPKKGEAPKEAPKAKEEAPAEGVKAAMAVLTNVLVNNGTITDADGQKIADILGVKLAGPLEGVYSKNELSRMFDGM